MSARWYKRCGADFIHGTMMLSLEEKGAYSLCLDLIYDRGGPIPDDARWLSGVCGVSIRKWNAIRDRLISLGKIYAENDLLSNVRADFELVSTELSSRERAESGAKGGRKRAENACQSAKNNDLAQAEPKREEKKREEEEGTPPSPPAGGRRGKHLLPSDWEVPTIAELPPKARACAEQWTAASYDTHAEAFASYWRGEGKMKSDWRGTWANRVVSLHSQVLRDQKFGNAPTAANDPHAKPVDPDAYRAFCLQSADRSRQMGREQEAVDWEAKARGETPRRNGSGPARSIGALTAGILQQAEMH